MFSIIGGWPVAEGRTLTAGELSAGVRLVRVAGRGPRVDVLQLCAGTTRWGRLAAGVASLW